MEYSIAVTNDFLSYITRFLSYLRLYIDGKAPLWVLSEIEEAVLAGENVIDILMGSVMRQLSRPGKNGSTGGGHACVIFFHLTNRRNAQFLRPTTGCGI